MLGQPAGISFHGRQEWAVNCGPFSVVCNWYAPHTYVPPHCHTAHCLFIVEQGSMFQAMPEGLVLLRQGVVGFHPPQLYHRNYAGSAGARICNMAICSEWLKRCRVGDIDSHHHSFFFADCFVREVQAILSGSKFPVPTRRLSDAVDRFLRRPNENGNREPRFSSLSRRAKQIVMERYVDSISLGKIARELEVNSSHLGRVFRREFGTSVGEFIKALQLDRACQLLLTTSRSISNTAYASGFCDQSDLTRRMKQEIGLTPGAFRKVYGSSDAATRLK